jgi:NitT/TauT family transport system permease protein
LKIGWSRGFRALISAEMIIGAISSIGGIGWYMYERRSFMDTTGMYAGIFLVVIVGILIEEVLFNHVLLRYFGKYE